MAKQIPNLQLEDNEPFQRVEWRLQRIGWVVWGLLIVSALAGLLGPGPLSKAESPAPDGSLTVAYDRFVHYHHPTLLKLVVRPSEQSRDSLQVKFSRQLLDRLHIDRIEPEPEGRRLGADGVVYTFPLNESTDVVSIMFHVEFERFGLSNAQIEVVGSEPATFTQMVYP
jgi:hypothetical protein